jgi:hypothetical protein
MFAKPTWRLRTHTRTITHQVKSATMALVSAHVGPPVALRETGTRREQSSNFQGSVHAAHVRSDTSFVPSEKKHAMNPLRGHDASGASSHTSSAQNVSGAGSSMPMGGRANTHVNAGSNEIQDHKISKSSTVRDRADTAADHRDASDKPPHARLGQSLVLVAKLSIILYLPQFDSRSNTTDARILAFFHEYTAIFRYMYVQSSCDKLHTCTVLFLTASLCVYCDCYAYKIPICMVSFDAYM